MKDISLIEKVEIALDEIRPYLNKDGGDIKVISIDNNNIGRILNLPETSTSSGAKNFFVEFLS